MTKTFSIKDISIKERIEAEKRGISYATLATRMYHGWTKERALTEVVKQRRKTRRKKKCAQY